VDGKKIVRYPSGRAGDAWEVRRWSVGRERPWVEGAVADGMS